jgi:hypothetical protein
VDEGAFHVVVIYRDSLQLVYQNTFNFDELYSDDPSVWTMTSALNDVANRGNYMVLISSIGNLPAKPNYWQAQWVRVGQALERLGGTYSLFMSLAAGDDYTFVGDWATARLRPVRSSPGKPRATVHRWPQTCGECWRKTTRETTPYHFLGSARRRTRMET